MIAPGVRSVGGDVVPSDVQASRDGARRCRSRVIGTRTEDCIRAGVMFGAADAIDGVVRPHQGRNGRNDEEPFVIATGGFAEMFAPLCRRSTRVEPHLTLQGLC